MNLTTSEQRAIAAASGLALGDALGYPASEHRTVRDPWVRSMLRKGPSELDQSRVLRPVVPFVLSSVGAVPMLATDDAEAFAVAATVLLEAGTTAETDALFDAWLRLMDHDDVWATASQRSALINAASDLTPPETGRDNPAFYDDSALPGAVAIGIAVSDPESASALAARFASITHDAIGVTAARVMAALVSRLVGEVPLDRAVELAQEDAKADDWLSDAIAEAMNIVDQAPTPFAAIPELIARFAPRTYSHPGTVSETLPLALALTKSTSGDHQRAIPLAMTVSRHQDSLPALVGALCGASGSQIDGSSVDVLQGVIVPSMANESLSELAKKLLALR